MSKIFVSYSRQSTTVAKNVIDDFKALGHTVWFDQELSGGQTWWNQILAQIQDCELFIFVLDTHALNSLACKREYTYAADLKKIIIPILVDEKVERNLLPQALLQIHLVDYLKQDRDSVIALAKALSKVPPLKPPPDPLPSPPEIPISQISNLAQRIDYYPTLSHKEQIALILDLKKGARNCKNAKDIRSLLNRFRRRQDLLATIAEEIDELIESIDGKSKDTSQSSAIQGQDRASLKYRLEATTQNAIAFLNLKSIGWKLAVFVLLIGIVFLTAYGIWLNLSEFSLRKQIIDASAEIQKPKGEKIEILDKKRSASGSSDIVERGCFIADSSRIYVALTVYEYVSLLSAIGDICVGMGNPSRIHLQLIDVTENLAEAFLGKKHLAFKENQNEPLPQFFARATRLPIEYFSVFGNRTLNQFATWMSNEANREEYLRVQQEICLSKRLMEMVNNNECGKRNDFKYASFSARRGVPVFRPRVKITDKGESVSVLKENIDWLLAPNTGSRLFLVPAEFFPSQ